MVVRCHHPPQSALGQACPCVAAVPPTTRREGTDQPALLPNPSPDFLQCNDWEFSDPVYVTKQGTCARW